MARSKSANPLNKKQDVVHLMILLTIALAIGVYLIATTILISKDGTSYVVKAQRFSSDPISIIKRYHIGYPFLIFAAHKLVTLFGGGSSLQTWIYSAQSITLLCQLLSIILLYLIGKLFVGSNKSFWAVLILIILPYPASFASDTLREWPHMLFLALGFLFLIKGAWQGKWLMFGAAGLAAGLGHIIRPECAQLVFFGAAWILIRFLKPRQQMGRSKLLCALVVLIIGFAIPAVPYTIIREKVLPAKIKVLISSAFPPESRGIQNPEINGGNYAYTASGVPAGIVKAIGKLISRISETLMHYYLPALLIGIYFHFRRKHPASDIERFFAPALVTLYIIMLIVLHCHWGYISRRHSFPLVPFTIFYIPTGLEVSADWLANRFSRSRPASAHDCRTWFFILLIIGTAICLPKLLTRPGSDKPGIRTAAAWLSENTAQEDYIAVTDRRISVYARRKGIVYETKPHRKAKYIVTIVKDENKVPDFVGNAQKQYSVWENERRKNKKIVIYKKTS
jgi:hypothetical protein